MSKRDELQNLRRQCSADAPINVHGRTGESADVSCMLDLYAHTDSPEEIVFARDDVKARKRFQKGFEVYMERIFDEREREFLRELLHGSETPRRVGAAFGVNYFEFLQVIQRKAYENSKPLIKLARLSKWASAESFISDIFCRLHQLQDGAELNAIIPQNKRELEQRARMKEYYIQNSEKIRARVRQYNKTHRQQRIEYKKQNREKNCEYVRRYRERNREKVSEYKRHYKKSNPEIVRNGRRRYYAKQCRKKLLLAFETLSERLVAWIEAGKPKDGEVYEALEAANKNTTRKFKNWYEKRDCH